MANSVILPASYQAILEYEGFNCDLLEKTLDMSNDPEFDQDLEIRFRKRVYNHFSSQRQKFFQTVLLYDDLFLPDADPTINFGRLDDYGFKTHEIEDELLYDATTEIDHDFRVLSLKKAVVRKFLEVHKHGLLHANLSMKPQKVAESIYDECFHLRTLSDEEKIEIIKIMEYLRKRAIERSPGDSDPSATEIISKYCSDVFSDMHLLYNEINWLLNLSADNNAYIINSGYDLTNLGISRNTKFDAYRTLKIAYKDVIGELPGFNDLKEVLDVKKQKRKELKGLRDEISTIEHILSSSNPDREQRALEIAIKDLKKAVAAVNKGLPVIEAVGDFTTVIGITLTVAGLFFPELSPLTIAGLFFDVSDGIMFCAGKKLEKSKWCEIIR